MELNQRQITLTDIKSKLNDYCQTVTGSKKASIIIPLLVKDDKINILFEVRAENLKSQPGDVCFPGGKIEENEKPVDAAIREIYEEIGARNIKIIDKLDIFVRYDGLIVYPYIGIMKNNIGIKINVYEVSHIFYVPLEFFIKNNPECYTGEVTASRPNDFPYDRIHQGQNYKFAKGKYDTYFYQYKNYTIWGLTAAIIKNFVDIITK